MSFVEQEDVFQAIEPVMAGVFKEFSDWKVPACSRASPQGVDAQIW